MKRSSKKIADFGGAIVESVRVERMNITWINNEVDG